MYRDEVHETMTGTPQGGIVSPLLANIYLHALDRYMESNYLSIPHALRDKRRKQGKSNFLYVRYADDFVVLCNGTKAEALAMKEELKGLLSTMRLTLSEEKTKITQSRQPTHTWMVPILQKHRQSRRGIRKTGPRNLLEYGTLARKEVQTEHASGNAKVL